MPCNMIQAYKAFMLVLTAFFSVMVQQYYLYIKALLYVVFNGFKAVGVYGVVVCKDNDKDGECSNNGVTGGVGCGDRLVVCFGWIGEGSQELRKLPCELYPNQNR